MSDNYQAVYDAVRSRIANTNMAGAISEGIRESIGNAGTYLLQSTASSVVEAIERCATQVAAAARRPSILLRLEPRKVKTESAGELWVVQHGDITASGYSPLEAAQAFDRIYTGV